MDSPDEDLARVGINIEQIQHGLTGDFVVAREALDTAESKQRSAVELMTVIHDRDVRLKLKQQLRGLVERIDVDLVTKQMAVFYVGQRMMPINPSE